MSGQREAGQLAVAVATPRAQPLHVAVVGVSTSQIDGVRDHAVLLSGALGHEGISCSLHWLWRGEKSLRGSRVEFRAWLKTLGAELDRARPAAVILHYSVFSYSHRGLPLFVRPTLSTLRGTGIPLVTVLHEYAYPWQLGGLHGKAWALTQRAVLIGVMRGSAAVLVTTPSRAEWLASRPWLPRREIAVAPVFSNLPEPAGGRERQSMVIGLFGYAYEGAAVFVALDALRLLLDRGLQVRLALLGAPGPGTAAAKMWLAHARTRAVEHALSFSGPLPAQELSNALAACQVLLHMEPSGPTPRKGTLAASLASGRPVVALDGPRRWAELMQSEAALVVAPSAGALAEAIAGLLQDEGRREALGDRGRAFVKRAMSVERSARVTAGMVRDLGGRRRL